MKVSRFVRMATLVCGGGVLIQVGGCGTLLAPAALGLIEQLLLGLLFGGIGF